MTIKIKTFDAQPRQRQKQQQSTNESSSSHTSLFSTHRRTSSFVRSVSDEDDSASYNRIISVTPSTINVMNPLHIMPWVHSASGSNSLSQENEMDCYLPESNKSESECKCIVDEDTLPALELIRELSFSPPLTPPRPYETETKKRTDTADTEESSLEPRRRSLSPLLGLQYLPDHGNIFVFNAEPQNS